MVQSKPLPFLLTDADLPETDNQPVDNELQVLIPVLLRAILALLWLYWYDQQGRRYPAPQDVIAQERELREQAEQSYRICWHDYDGRGLIQTSCR